MKRPFTLITAIVISLQTYASADSVRNHSISLSIGPGLIQRQDLIFTPNIYSGFNPLNGAIRYHVSGKWSHDIQIGFQNYSVSQTGEYNYLADGEEVAIYPHTFTFVALDYTVEKRIFQTDNMEIYAGGSFSNRVDALNYGFGFASYFGYFASFGLNATGSIDFDLTESDALSAGVSIPLASLVARSPYLVNDDEFMINSYSHNGLKTFFAYLADGKFETVNHFQQLDFDLAYRRMLNTKWSLGLNYRFEIKHYSPVEPLTSISNQFLLSADFKF